MYISVTIFESQIPALLRTQGSETNVVLTFIKSYIHG